MLVMAIEKWAWDAISQFPAEERTPKARILSRFAWATFKIAFVLLNVMMAAPGGSI